MPNTPGPETGTKCTLARSIATVVIGAQTDSSTDLAHYKVELITNGGILSTISVLPSSSDQLNGDGSTTLNFTGIDMTATAAAVIQARVTAIDQCDQQCVTPLVVNCTLSGQCTVLL